MGHGRRVPGAGRDGQLRIRRVQRRWRIERPDRCRIGRCSEHGPERGRQSGGQRCRAGRGPAAAPVGAAGPVRRLLRRARSRATTRRPASRSRCSMAARTSSRRPSARRPMAPNSRSAGSRRCSRPREGTPASDLVNIAQIFQRSGTLSVSWKESNITQPARLQGQEGRRVGLRQRVRGHGRGHQGRPGRRDRLHEGHPADFDMSLLLTKRDRCRRGDDLQRVRPGPRGQEPRDRRAVQADRPQRHQLQRRRAPRCSRTRSSPRASWLPRPGNEDIATRFLKASFQGWIYCRDQSGRLRPVHGQRRARTLGAGHQAWMMNEINPLIWPSPNGIGIMDPAEWQQTVDVALARRHHQGRPAGRGVSERTSRPRLWPGSPTTPRARTSPRAKSRSPRAATSRRRISQTRRAGPRGSALRIPGGHPGVAGVARSRAIAGRRARESRPNSPAAGVRLLTSGLGQA